ncbi:MAG: ABC transporter permease [Dehalococcoidales bacterium]|nr:MAG: ABC transporter permease [Dehalococcoidales bacterium]
MQAYLIRRVLLIFPTLVLLTIIVFLSVRFIPGDVVDMIISEVNTEGVMSYEEARDMIRDQLGLDTPIHEQYWEWIKGVIRGDLGTSMRSDKPVTDELLSKIPISLELGILSMLTGQLIAIPLGIYSAIRQDSPADYAGRSFAILMLSLPNFWIMTMVIVFPAVWWNWMPPLEYIPFTQDPAGNLIQFIIPAFIMGASFSGAMTRFVRTVMLEVLRQDYIRTAWSKGLSERSVVFRHALRNTLIPLVTIVGMGLPNLIAGSVITEQIFNLPGIGRWLFDAVTQRDYPVISGMNLVMASLVLFCNLAVDITYAWLDPRVKYR